MIDLAAFNMIKAGAETNTRIFTPQKIVKEMLDALPPEIWNSHTTFLDPAVKSGVYLVEIFNRLMESPEVIKDFPDKQERAKHILENQLFGIAIDDFDCLIAQRNLYGQINPTGNIRVISDYKQRIKDKNKTNIVKSIEKVFLKEGEKVKFDIVVGNPPYQDATQSIYQHFVDMSLLLSKRFVYMITKNNWINSDTLSITRDNMIKAGLVYVKNYPVTSELFENASVAVSIFGIDKEHKGLTHCVEIRENKITNDFIADLRTMPIVFTNEMEYNIFTKVKNDLVLGHFGQLTYPSECFRIAPNGTVGRGNNKYVLNDFEQKSDEHSITVIYMSTDKKPYYKYINEHDVPARQELINKHKVVCGRILSNDNMVIRNINITEKKSVCTSSWGILFAHDELSVSQNVASYIATKFFRFMTKYLCEDGTIVVSAYRFSCVPQQDFTNNSDIDWSQSIADIDRQLYEKYNLSDEEIDYIEKTIKPM